MIYQNQKQLEFANTIIVLFVLGTLLLPLRGWSQDDPVEKLITDLKDENSSVRGSAAWALDTIGGVEAQEALKVFLKGINLQQVAAGYQAFISRGEADTEGLLIFVLQRYGSETMAADFWYSGNGKLHRAATIWAEQHGYSIPSGRKGALRWGSGEK